MYVLDEVSHVNYLLLLFGVLLVFFSFKCMIKGISNIASNREAYRLSTYQRFSCKALFMSEMYVGDEFLNIAERIIKYDGSLSDESFCSLVPYTNIRRIVEGVNSVTVFGIHYGNNELNKYLRCKEEIEEPYEFSYRLEEGFYKGYNKDEFLNIMSEKGVKVDRMPDILEDWCEY